MHPLLASVLQTLSVLGLTILLAYPLGIYIDSVYDGRVFWARRVLGPVEEMIYHLAGSAAHRNMDWKRYALSFLAFNGLGALSLYVQLLWQEALPFNPERFAGMSPIMAFNTAVSFVTTTNLQDYGGESTLSYLSQAAGLAQQNFLAAASGVATLLTLARTFMRSEGRGLGNFWVDTTRTVLYLFLPLSAIFTVFYIQQGAIENGAAYVHANLIQPLGHDGHWIRHQVLAMGLAASQEAITILAGDGGAFFNAGAAHPFVNPTPLSNLGQMVSFLLIPTTLIFWFGRAFRRPRVAWAILACTTPLRLPRAVTSEAADLVSNPQFPPSVSRTSGPDAGGGGNLEAVDLRFGSGAGALFGSLAATTGAGMSGYAYDSMMPLSSGINMVFMQLGDLLFVGVGVGLESFLATMIFAVFLAGLMTRRSPVFLAKKIEAFEVKIVDFSLLVMPVLVLLTTALAISPPDGRAAVFNPGPRDLARSATNSPAQ